MAKSKPSPKSKKYRYYLQPSSVNWDLLSNKATKKYQQQDIYIKKSLKFTLDKTKAVSFPDLRSGEKGAEAFAQNILGECQKLYGNDFDIDVVRVKKPKK